MVTTAIFTDAGGNGLWTVADIGSVNRWEENNVWDGATSRVAGTAVDGVDEAPRYVIEHVASVIREENAYQLNDPYAANAADRIEIFRITARGIGGSANARVLLQTTFGRILD